SAECRAEIPHEPIEKNRSANGEYAGEMYSDTLPPPEVAGTMLTSPVAEPPSPRSTDSAPGARHLLGSAQTGETGLQRVSGYRIEKELGRGGMGAVYLAVNEQTGERVALKMMLPHKAASQRLRDQFMREAANMKVLRHRHVVQLRDLDYSEGSFFFTLEYCE